MAQARDMSGLREWEMGSLLVVPALFVVGAIILSGVTVLSDEILFGVVPEAVLFRGDVASARSMLTTIAGSTITLTGLVFSVTMLVLQLTAAQYSPRAVGALLTDRNSKLTLGVFVGTFVYSLAVLRTISPDGDEFGRSISVAVAVLLALLTIGFFIQYVNHVAHQIRPSSIISRVADAAEATIESQMPDEPQPIPVGRPLGDPDRVVSATDHGVVQSVEVERLLERAVELDLQIEVVPRVGEFVPRDAALLRIWGAMPDEDDEDDGLHDLVQLVPLAGDRSMHRDLLYGFRQLVDIAERALSPGTNDPTTAVQSVDQIHHLLRQLVCRTFPNGLSADDEGRLRVIVHEPDWQDILDLAVDEIAHYGDNSLQIRRRFTTMLQDLALVAPPERRHSINEKLRSLEGERQRS